MRSLLLLLVLTATVLADSPPVTLTDFGASPTIVRGTACFAVGYGQAASEFAASPDLLRRLARHAAYQEAVRWLADGTWGSAPAAGETGPTTPAAVLPLARLVEEGLLPHDPARYYVILTAPLQAASPPAAGGLPAAVRGVARPAAQLPNLQPTVAVDAPPALALDVVVDARGLAALPTTGGELIGPTGAALASVAPTALELAATPGPVREGLGWLLLAPTTGRAEGGPLLVRATRVDGPKLVLDAAGAAQVQALRGERLAAGAAAPRLVVVQGASAPAALTGVVLDGTACRLERGITPRLVTSSGAVVWQPPADLSREAVLNTGVVEYRGTVAAALQGQRAGATPLLLEGVGCDSTYRANPVVTTSQAALLHLANARFRLLDERRIVLVTPPR